MRLVLETLKSSNKKKVNNRVWRINVNKEMMSDGDEKCPATRYLIPVWILTTQPMLGGHLSRALRAQSSNQPPRKTPAPATSPTTVNFIEPSLLGAISVPMYVPEVGAADGLSLCPFRMKPPSIPEGVLQSRAALACTAHRLGAAVGSLLLSWSVYHQQPLTLVTYRISTAHSHVSLRRRMFRLLTMKLQRTSGTFY